MRAGLQRLGVQLPLCSPLTGKIVPAIALALGKVHAADCALSSMIAWSV